MAEARLTPTSFNIQVVEMDIALMGDKADQKRGSWTSDSEADSTPSHRFGFEMKWKKGKNYKLDFFSENSFTSDTDVSSSSSCSSSSSEDGESRDKKKESTKDTSEETYGQQRKRPLIEELPSPTRAKTPRQS